MDLRDVPAPEKREPNWTCHASILAFGHDSSEAMIANTINASRTAKAIFQKLFG